MRPHGDIIHLRFNRSDWKKNHWKARLCWGCKWLHVGKSVSHNHCDHPYVGEYGKKRVHNYLPDYWPKECDRKELIKKKP